MEALRMLVLTAMESEARAVAGAWGMDHSSTNSFIWMNADRAVVTVGIRGSNLARAETLLRDRRPQVLILAGLAGALDPSLAIGSIVIEGWPDDRPLPSDSRAGRFHCSTGLVSTTAEKARLFAQTGCAAVEMEAAAIAPFAARAGVPLLHIRAISDTATDAINPDCLSLIDADGRPQLSSALALLARKPAALPGLLRLRKNTNLALNRLSQTLRHLGVSEWRPA